MTVEVALLPPAAAEDAALVAELTARINAAYGEAEEELWVPGNERIEPERVAEIVRAGEMAVAQRDGRAVGSVRVRNVGGGAGYFGLLAVDPADQGAGVGRALIRYAEDLSRDRGATRMELRLVVPRDGTDEGKHRLFAWYSRLGYETAARDDFSASHPDSTAHMRTPLDILTMRKRLS